MKLTKPQTALITGIVLMGIVIGLLFLLPLPVKQRFVIIRILIALGSGAIASTITGFFNFRYKDLVTAGGGLGVFALVYLINPAMVDGDNFTITVFIHGAEGRSDIVLQRSGEVSLDLKGDRRIEKIDDKGAVTFKEIPVSFIGQKVPITVNAGIYQPMAKDSLYTLLENEAYYIKVLPTGLGTINGYVMDEQLHFVKDAIIQVQSAVVVSDSLGRFHLTVPPQEQKRRQRMTVSKKNYELWIAEVTPETKEEVEVKLKKSVQ